MDPLLPLLRDLIAIPSVNPSLVPGGTGEAEIGVYVAARLRAIGMDVEVYDALPGRPNVVGMRGRPGARSSADVLRAPRHRRRRRDDGAVRSGRASGAPVRPRRPGHEGRLAAMIHAAESVLHRGGLRRGRLIVAAVADEEYASAGADALVARSPPTTPSSPSRPISRSAWRTKVLGRRNRHARPRRARQPPGRRPRRHPPHGPRARSARSARSVAAGAAAGSAARHRSLHASMIEGGGELSSYPAAAACSSSGARCRRTVTSRKTSCVPSFRPDDRRSGAHRRYPPAPGAARLCHRSVSSVACFPAARMCAAGASPGCQVSASGPMPPSSARAASPRCSSARRRRSPQLGGIRPPGSRARCRDVLVALVERWCGAGGPR